MPDLFRNSLGRVEIADGTSRCLEPNPSPLKRRNKRLVVKALGPEGHPIVALGQVARVLLAIAAAGETGITPLASETWSLRLSDHIRKLKKRHGLHIVTLWARHDDGRHARYVLRSKVSIIEAHSA